MEAGAMALNLEPPARKLLPKELGANETATGPELASAPRLAGVEVIGGGGRYCQSQRTKAGATQNWMVVVSTHDSPAALIDVEIFDR